MYYGVHYEYPFGGMCDRNEWKPRGKADFEVDLALIRETGFNSIRIRIGMDSNLDEVAQLLDIAHAQGLSVLFGFATFYVNDAFVRDFPDSKIIGADGSVIPIDEKDLRWQRACIDHPEYRKGRNELLAACAERFGTHPAVSAFCVHNEPSVGPVPYPCYCKNTLAKYHADLIRRFHSVEGINRALGADFADESSVRPPASRDEKPKLWDDWRIYQIENLSAFLNEGRDIIKARVPEGTPITYNVTYAYGPAQNGQDWWNEREYPLVSSSLYMNDTEFAVTWDISCLALLKALAGDSRDVYLTEFQGGAMPSAATRTLYTSAEIDLSMKSAVASGVKGIYIYRWDPLLCGAEPMVNGLTEVNYTDTERRLGMKKTLAELRLYEETLNTARPTKPRVGIYLSRSQLLAASLRENTRTFQSSMAGAYGMLSDLGYEAAFIIDGFTENCGYEAVLFPYTEDFDVDLRALTLYVKSGGLAIVDLPANEMLAKPIAEALGVECSSAETLRYLLYSGWSLDAAGVHKGYAIDSRLSLSGGETALTYRDNGMPAAIFPDGYEKRLMVFGFGAGYSYAKTLHFGVRNVVGDFLKPHVSPDFVVEGISDELRPYVETRGLTGEKGNLMIVVNRSRLSLDLAVNGIRFKLDAYSAKIQKS